MQYSVPELSRDLKILFDIDNSNKTIGLFYIKTHENYQFYQVKQVQVPETEFARYSGQSPG